jgi:hypothetical protein
MLISWVYLGGKRFAAYQACEMPCLDHDAGVILAKQAQCQAHALCVYSFAEHLKPAVPCHSVVRCVCGTPNLHMPGIGKGTVV